MPEMLVHQVKVEHVALAVNAEKWEQRELLALGHRGAMATKGRREKMD